MSGMRARVSIAPAGARPVRRAAVRAWGCALVALACMGGLLAGSAHAQAFKLAPPGMPASAFAFDGPAIAPVHSEASLYTVHCAGCHNMDGSGHPNQGVPDMRGVLGYFQKLPQGRAFLVQVPGVNNAGLDNAQITRLTNWVVQRFSAATVPAGWKPYTQEEVEAYRLQRPSEISATRARIVQELEALGMQHASSHTHH